MRFRIALALFLAVNPALAQQDRPIKFPSHHTGWKPIPLPVPLGPKADPTPPPTTENLVQFLAQFTANDLQGALNLANAQSPPDQTSAMCWSGLIPIVANIQSQLPSGTNGTPIGIAMAVQIARDFINTPQSPVLKQVNLACAALYVDTKVGLLNFAGNLTGALTAAAAAVAIAPKVVPGPVPVIP